MEVVSVRERGREVEIWGVVSLRERGRDILG